MLNQVLEHPQATTLHQRWRQSDSKNLTIWGGGGEGERREFASRYSGHVSSSITLINAFLDILGIDGIWYSSIVVVTIWVVIIYFFVV